MGRSSKSIGQTIPQHRVVKKLRGGGMGIVYKVENTSSLDFSR
jgi:hypothetical protein